MNFETWSGTGTYPLATHRWVADYSRYIAPELTRNCYTSNTDGLNANQARKLGAELQLSLDNCSIDAYARQLFAKSWQENSVPDCVRYEDLFGSEFPKHEQERHFSSAIHCVFDGV